MFAGIVGDVIGSVYEAYQWQRKDLPLIQDLPFSHDEVKPLLKNVKWVRENYGWTDDTLCTLALYHAYINNMDPVFSLVYFCKKYGNETIGFGKAFNQWIDDPKPYESLGNGAIMRLGFIPYLSLSLSEQLSLAHRYTAISHNHADSFSAVYDFITICYQLKENHDKKSIDFVLDKYNYRHSVQDLHHQAKFEMNALQTLLQSLVIVKESENMEDIYRFSFYVGGDSDTLACIAGNIGSHLYDLPRHLLRFAFDKLEPHVDLMELIHHFFINHWVSHDMDTQ